jgi:hypothetical protein
MQVAVTGTNKDTRNLEKYTVNIPILPAKTAPTITPIISPLNPISFDSIYFNEVSLKMH